MIGRWLAQITYSTQFAACVHIFMYAYVCMSILQAAWTLTRVYVNAVLMALHCICAAFLQFMLPIANMLAAGVELALHCCTILLAVVMVNLYWRYG